MENINHSYIKKIDQGRRSYFTASNGDTIRVELDFDENNLLKKASKIISWKEPDVWGDYYFERLFCEYDSLGNWTQIHLKKTDQNEHVDTIFVHRAIEYW